MGRLEKGYEMIRRSMDIDFQYPKWLHMGICLYHLDDKQYDKMLLEATKMDQLDFHWIPLLKLVAYDHLFLKDEADKQFKILCSIKPDFENRPVEYIEVLVKSKSLSSEIYNVFSSVSETAHHISILGK